MNKLLHTLALVAVTLALVGCIGAPGGPATPINFYRLEYTPKNDEADVAAKHEEKLLEKVTSAGILKTPRMLMAPSEYELDYAESKRWAEPLTAAFTRILVVGLRQDFGEVEGVPVNIGYHPDYRVNVMIEKLWGTAKGEILLSVSWQVTNAKDALVASGRKDIRRSGWRTGDYRQLAERVSSMTPELVEAVRDTLSSLDEAKENL